MTLRSAGALSTLRSSSFGLQDASPLKIWIGSPCSLEDTLPCCTPHCAEAEEQAQLAKLRASCEHLLQTPGLGLAAAAALDLTRGSSRGCKPGLPTIARQSVRLWLQLRRLLQICLAVGKEREETSGMVWFEGKSNVGPEGSSGSASSLARSCFLPSSSPVSGSRRSPTWFLECRSTAAL